MKVIHTPTIEFFNKVNSILRNNLEEDDFNEYKEKTCVDLDSDSITKLSPHPTILNASILFVAHSKFTLGTYSIDLDESDDDRLVIYYNDKIERSRISQVFI